MRLAKERFHPKLISTYNILSCYLSWFARFIGISIYTRAPSRESPNAYEDLKTKEMANVVMDRG